MAQLTAQQFLLLRKTRVTKDFLKLCGIAEIYYTTLTVLFD
jgi:hypothetical protein